MKNSLSKGKPQEKIDAISNKFQESKMNFAV